MADRDPFRYCVYCGADCYVEWYDGGAPEYADEIAHEPDCATVIGLYPVTPAVLGMRGPDDPYAHGMVCMDCGVEFKVGDVYAHRPTDQRDVFEVVCVGCRVLNPEAVDAA